MRVGTFAIASLLIVISACSSEENSVAEVGEAAATECRPALGFAGVDKLMIQEGVSDWPPSHREYDVDAELDDTAGIALIVDELSEAECVEVGGGLTGMPEPDHLVMFGESDSVTGMFGYYRDPVRWGEQDTESRWLTLGEGGPAPLASTVELPEEGLG